MFFTKNLWKLHDVYIYIYTWQVFVTFWGMVKWLLQWSFDLQIGAKKVTLNHLACTNICTFVYVYIFKCSKTKRTLIISITPHADFYQYIFGGDSPILNHQARRVIWWILRQEVTWFYHEMTIYSQITCWEWDQLGWIHPGRLTWNLRIHLWKRKIIFQTIIFRFYDNLWGCKGVIYFRHFLTRPTLPGGTRTKKTMTMVDLTHVSGPSWDDPPRIYQVRLSWKDHMDRNRNLGVLLGKIIPTLVSG